MNKYILKIKGMRCGMCEMHVQDAINKKIKAVKVKASHIKNELIVISELELKKEDFIDALSQTGYEILSFDKQIAVKKLFGWK